MSRAGRVGCGAPNSPCRRCLLSVASCMGLVQTLIDMHGDSGLGCFATSGLVLVTADSFFWMSTMRRKSVADLCSALVTGGRQQRPWSGEVVRRVRCARIVDYGSPTRLLLTGLLCSLILLCALPHSACLGACPLAFGRNSEPATQESRLPTLELGRRVQGSIADKQHYCYRLPLSKGQFIQLALTTINSNLVFTLSSPKGEKLIDLNTSDGPGGTPTCVLDYAGAWGLRHCDSFRERDCIDRELSLLELQELRTTVANDEVMVEAQTAFLEAEALRRTENGNSLEAAVSNYQRAAERWKAALKTIQQAQMLTQLGLVYNNWGRMIELYGLMRPSLARQGRLCRESGHTAQHRRGVLQPRR